MAITEKEYPIDRSRPGIMVVRHTPIGDKTCSVEDCRKPLAKQNKSGVCTKCQGRKLWPCGKAGCTNLRTFSVDFCTSCTSASAAQARAVAVARRPARFSDVKPKNLPALYSEGPRSEGPRIARPPKYPVPDNVMRNGKNVNPRGFWASVKVSGDGQLWHTCRKYNDIPSDYLPVCHVSYDRAGPWLVQYVEVLTDAA